MKRWLAFANLLKPTHIGDELNELDAHNSGAPMPIRVALVEAPSLMRDGISRILQDAAMTVDWVGDSLSELIESETLIDVIVLDFDLVGHDIDPLDIRRVQRCGARILLCTTATDDLRIAPLLDSGVAGAVSQSVGFEELLAAVQVVAAGGTWLTPSQRRQAPEAGLELSTQQIEVLRRYAAGLKLATVARQLRISPNTVSYHLRMIRQKSERAGARATTQRDMLRLAQRLGIEPIDADT